MSDNRRRALMSSKKENIIKGNKQTWEQGYISSVGINETSNYVIRTTNYIPITGGKILTYITPLTDENDVHYYAYICQYNSNNRFISRKVAKGTAGAIIPIILNADCAKIKITLGHNESSGVTVSPSEGNLVTIGYTSTSRQFGTWNDLFESIDNGTYATDYKIGDGICLDMGTGGIYYMQIVGINTDTLENSTDTAAISLISICSYKTPHRMNPAYVEGTIQTGTLGGWPVCEMRTYLQETIYPMIPQNVRNRIVTVKKYERITNVDGTQTNNVLSNDYIWIPSNKEMNQGGESVGPCYSSIFSGNVARKKYYGTSTTTKMYYTRSASTATKYINTHFSTMAVTGAGNTATADSTGIYFPIGFCIN